MKTSTPIFGAQEWTILKIRFNIVKIEGWRLQPQFLADKCDFQLKTGVWYWLHWRPQPVFFDVQKQKYLKIRVSYWSHCLGHMARARELLGLYPTVRNWQTVICMIWVSVCWLWLGVFLFVFALFQDCKELTIFTAAIPSHGHQQLSSVIKLLVVSSICMFMFVHLSICVCVIVFIFVFALVYDCKELTICRRTSHQQFPVSQVFTKYFILIVAFVFVFVLVSTFVF